MASKGDCCYPPCSTCDGNETPALSNVTFSSPDGLHPINFSSGLRGAKPSRCMGIAAALNVQNTYATSPAFPANANNASCRFPGESLSWLNDSDTPSNLVAALDGSCCWSGLAVPDSIAASAGRQHHFEESIYSLETRNFVYTYDGYCTSGTWDAGTYTFDEYYDVKASGYAKRFVFGLSLKACWQLNGYGIPFLRLSAKVFYKDWCNFVSAGRYSLYEAFTGAPIRHRFVGIGPNGENGPLGCITVPALPAYAFYRCGSGAPFVEPADATIPNPIQCLDCDQETVPNTTNQPILTPLNCTVETIERTIDIPTDSACSLIGTHVFNGPVEQPTKFAVGNSCLLSAIGCAWRYPTTDCPGLIPFPTPGTSSVTRPATGSELQNYSSVTFNYAASNAVTNYRDSGDGKILMKWWTEPWTITIS